ncbi:peptidyl-prolyl cis-trans isomerase CYP26-2, chloroplastic-like [Actinidia eriantha]|uniref:peptidyl-prolyl cis-trans isomerase CYP26-2, chloroplastic-like n=1 Tax=Actinidia eriantha TaxID=165200 RepID=UPI00258F971B|nr:peptidyl-prolyl cis-trans isomerase CYP26-2, chloroplastic-like [Actinidia eriantha]
MWQTPKLFQSSAQFLLTPPPPLSLSPIQDSPTSPSPLSLKPHCQFSRRDLAIITSPFLLLGPHQTLDLFHLSKALAEENPPNTNKNGQGASSNTIPSPSCIDTTLTKKAFLDISINGEPIGRIVIGLFGNTAPAGVARFTDIISGAAGISYRRKEFVKIMPSYVQHGGLRSYGVDAELAKKTGRGLANENLQNEWERANEICLGTKNLEGSVSIIVRDPLKPPPKLKLVAKGGKLEIDEEEVGTDPNGTEFTIATKDSPELDVSALVVGRVLEGMEVVQRIGKVKTVQENTSSPYFRVAKLIGDKRAIVAERGFNRPYSKVVISNCGLLE